MRLKIEKEKKLQEKERAEVEQLQEKPDIASKFGKSAEESSMTSPIGATKWDWLYKVGVEKVLAMKLAGKKTDDIIFEREQNEFTFTPSRELALQALTPKSS
jgi:hypothetical protein